MFIHCENSSCKYYFEDSCLRDLDGDLICLDVKGRCEFFEYEESESYKLMKNGEQEYNNQMICNCPNRGTEIQCRWCGEHTVDWAAVDIQKILKVGCKMRSLPQSETIHGEADETCAGCALLWSEEE